MSPTPDVAGAGDRAVSALLGAMSGFVMALVTLRTRFAMGDRDRREANARMDRQEQLQRATLRVVADLARAAGIDKRFNDELVNLLGSGERES